MAAPKKTAPAKAGTDEPVAAPEPAADEPGPALEADVQAAGADGPEGGPAGDAEGADAPLAGDDSEADASSGGTEPDATPEELALVSEPCVRCFPQGWPARELGAFVNCAHGFAIAFGETVPLSVERAKELGFERKTSEE